jgi:hypothetical protein
MKKVNISIMKTMDEFVLTQIEKLKESPQFHKVVDKYNSLEESEHTIANAILMGITIIVPFIFIIIFYAIFNSQNSILTQNEAIIHSASKIIAQSKELKSQKSQTFGREVTTQSSLKSMISGVLSSSGIDTSKVTIDNFEIFETAGINEVNATVQFKELSSHNVYALLQNLILTNKFKAKNINIEKNRKIQLLNGSIDVIYFSKSVSNNE